MYYSGMPIKAPWHQYKDRTDFPAFANLRRAGFETTLRRLVITTCPNVKYMTGAVTALLKSEASTENVDAVRVRSLDGEESSLSATLVIGKSQFYVLSLYSQRFSCPKIVLDLLSAVFDGSRISSHPRLWAK